MNAPPSYDAIVVSYRSGSAVGACLRALGRQTHPPREVVVVENGGEERTRAIAAQGLPRARVMLAPRNLGYAGGVNRAARETGAEWILACNPDAILEPDYAERTLARAARTERCGMAQGLLYRWRGGREEIDSLGHLRGRDRWFRNRGEGAPAAESAEWAARDADALVGVTGAAGFFLRRMFEALGGFDEALESFLEDADLGLRATASGWRTVVAHEARARHDRGRSYRDHRSGRDAIRFRLVRNRILVSLKNDPWTDLARDLPRILAWDAAWAVAAATSPLAWGAAFASAVDRAPVFLARRKAVRAPLAASDLRERIRRRLRAAPPVFRPVGAVRGAIDAVVVSHNNARTLGPLLNRLRRDESVAGLVCVDAASRDGSGEIARAVSGVRTVPLEENPGYARAANLGAARSEAGSGRAPILLVANGDVLPRGPLAPLLGAFDDPRVAMVAPRLLHPDGSLQPSTHGDPTLLKFLGQRWPPAKALAARVLAVASRRGWGEAASFWRHDRARDVAAVAGAVFLVRRAVWEEVGGMDEGFFLWHEDADLCRRLRNLGYRIRFDPALEVTHELGGSRRTLPDDEVHRSRSRLRYARRHWSAPARFLLERWERRGDGVTPSA